MFAGLNAQVLGISVDHVPCLCAWADSLGGITFPLLSDFWPHGAVSDKYGVLRTEEGYPERAIFVVDKEGVIRYIDVHKIDEQPDNEELRKVLRDLQPSLPRVKTIFPAMEEEELPTGGITLYCAKWCKDCRKARAWLDERGLLYTEVDVDYNLKARKQVREWGGGSLITPTLDIYGTIVLDYNESKMLDALRKAGKI